MTDPALSLSNVSVAYGRREVVHQVSLDVQPGETFGLIGLNGVGKTTLIKAMLGLRRCSGSVRVAGQDRLHATAKRNVTYLPERFDPPTFLRGGEFLRFSVQLYSRHYDEAAALALCDQLALDPAALRRRVQTYSKGMRQKLGLIATLLTECAVMILDEPMSGLDPEARARVKMALGVAKGQGRTLFFSSHILADMNEICDRVGVIDDGRLVFIGPPAALLDAGGDPNIERAFLNLIGRHAPTPAPVAA